MNTSSSRDADPALRNFALALLALAFISGGSSMDRGWADVATQLLALPVAWLAVARLLRPPVPAAHWVLVALAALGPVWVAAQGWLGTTATPWATERAVYAWLPPMAAFLAALALPPDSRRLGLKLLAGLATASLLLAILQLATPQDSLLNPFPDLVPVFNGLLANPNHQGTALGIGAVLLLSGATATDPAAATVVDPRGTHEARRRALRYGRLGLGGMLLVALPFTNSRAMVLIAAAAVMVLPLASGWLGSRWRRRHREGRRHVMALALLGIVGLGAVAFAALGWMRVDRSEEGRSALAGQTAALAAEAMPLGTGAGSFVPWFDAQLPETALRYEYVNHAHNDYLQWWLEGGIAGLAWIAMLLGGFVWARPRRRADRHRPDPAWVGSWLGVGILLAHSVVDYPLRTPALATAGAWMAAVAVAATLRHRRALMQSKG